MKAKKEVLNVASDFTAAGIPTGITKMLEVLRPDLQSILSLALPALACVYNSFNRTINEKTAKKDIEKLEELLSDLRDVMKQRQIEELQNFTNLDFPIEMYSVVEEIIKEGVNAKGKLLRKLSAQFVVIFGSADHTSYQAGAQLCLEIIKGLNENDLKLLLLYELTRRKESDRDFETQTRNQEITEVKMELLNDSNVFAHTILVSSKKLVNLGLIRSEPSLIPYDDGESNKDAMIEDFISKNFDSEVTAYYSQLQKYLHGFVP